MITNLNVAKYYNVHHHQGIPIPCILIHTPPKLKPSSLTLKFGEFVDIGANPCAVVC
jgi:hypothetical protein